MLNLYCKHCEIKPECLYDTLEVSLCTYRVLPKIEEPATVAHNVKVNQLDVNKFQVTIDIVAPAQQITVLGKVNYPDLEKELANYQVQAD